MGRRSTIQRRNKSTTRKLQPEKSRSQSTRGKAKEAEGTRPKPRRARAQSKTDEAETKVIPRADTYAAAVDDCVRIVEDRLAEVDPLNGTQLRYLVSELRSLHPGANERRERTRAGMLEAIIDDFASRIVQAAVYDLAEAEQRKETSGNICANVSLSFPITHKWLKYAGSRGDAEALRLLRYIEQQRNPSTSQGRPQAPLRAIPTNENLGPSSP